MSEEKAASIEFEEEDKEEKETSKKEQEGTDKTILILRILFVSIKYNTQNHTSRFIFFLLLFHFLFIPNFLFICPLSHPHLQFIPFIVFLLS